ncbi:hypothetical protein [Polaromonas eurypsychrophila]|uniref:hypothetical protein n=1 Tax=Polaromonas eurypsychrophila TaxID=1614635 RepID=UPI00166C6905|nr:hypothetical protein [Polaromonas eurypsychrophila]
MISVPALAGGISFRLSATDSTLIVTLLGESQAFYPSVLRMLPDGRWEPLATKPGSVLPAELLPGKNYALEWPDTRPLQGLTQIERLLPVMVRYFEVGGVSFGQIVFINAPPPAIEILQASYVNGLLVVTPPEANHIDSATSNTIHATWVLWPQEEGIALISEPLRFEHVQPPARRIEWQSGASAVHINTGKGQPDAMLLHETAQGYVLQTVAGSGLQGRQQRAVWLEASSKFYGMALLSALVAVIALLLYFIRAARGSTVR